jgi:nucleotide-binding universal stress UspA family protein
LYQIDYLIILPNVQYVTPTTLQTAKANFQQARKQAQLETLLARFQGQSADLLAYDDIYRKLKATGSSARGLRQIPLDAIVGSVNRANDFSRTFLPRNSGNEERWANLLAIADEKTLDALPPIHVYQIGSAYFVQDGHHRVSIARRQGLSQIHAYVTEVRARVPLTPDVQPDELIWRAEYAQFLEECQLDQLRPGANLSVSVAGQYAHLEAHIEAHRYLQETAENRDIPWQEAVVNWYDQAYLPLVEAIREHNLLRDFPGRTETDLYLWLAERRIDLRRELHWELSATAVAADLAREGDPVRPPSLARRATRRVLQAVLPEPTAETGQWRRKRLLGRYSDGLFHNILVLVSGSPAGWRALNQAFTLTGREQARIHGLRLAPPTETAEEAAVEATAFHERCFHEAAGCSLAVEKGDLADKLIQRAELNDLIVFALQDTQNESSGVSAHCQKILRRAPRPTLIVIGEWSNLSRPLLIYDDSDKSREALFAAAYMGERWGVGVTVIAANNGAAGREALTYARAYLELHEIEAVIHEHTQLTADLILQTAADLECDFLISGGYRSGKMTTAVRGSRLNDLLQQTTLPILICR